MTVYEGRNGPEALWLSQTVLGFSGDEYVNGAWAVEIEDRAGVGLTIESLSLTIGSRWDWLPPLAALGFPSPRARIRGTQRRPVPPAPENPCVPPPR